MLIDELLNSPECDGVTARGWWELRTLLGIAKKFELAPDFAAAADSLAMNLQVVSHALPYCRLPFRCIFIEVAQQARPNFAAAAIHVPGIQVQPIRVGFLMIAKDEDHLDHFLAYQFWSIRNPIPGFVPYGCATVVLSFNTKAVVPDDFEIEDRAIQYFNVPQSPEWKAAPLEVKKALTYVIKTRLSPYASVPQGMEEFTLELGSIDWSGESNFILATLALLNTVNTAEVSYVDYGKLNAKRAKQNRPPLTEYGVLKINPRIKKRIIGDADAHGHRELIAHLVRGHWKVRKSGIYWWRPHTRGSKGTPTDRTYRVL